MRWIILGVVGVLTLLTVVAYAFILPEERERADLMLAYFDAARAIVEDDPGAPDGLVTLLSGWQDDAEDGLSIEEMARVATLPPAERDKHLVGFQAYLETTGVLDLETVPTLVWSTDDNPARRSQLRLFRAWHLLNYAQPVDIVSDPSNRDITKTVVQCVAGAGPDLIEGYGPEQLRPFVRAGVALDVTDEANEFGFGTDTVFEGVVSSIAFEGRQYAYPCNVGYTVLFYHRDLFAAAGVPE
ncbi:MAG: extracellular solute-binding protein, partial [Planctomycetota bacterium]